MYGALSLSAYNLWMEREPRAAGHTGVRPHDGPLIWVHMPDGAEPGGIVDLAQRLAAYSSAGIVLTAQGDIAAPPEISRAAPPDERLSACESFLAYWQPQIVLIGEGALRPLMLRAAFQRKVPTFLINAQKPYLTQDAPRFIPGLLRASVQQVSQVFAVGGVAARAFQNAGVPPGKITSTKMLEVPSALPPCDETVLRLTCSALEARPIWCAVDVLPSEEEAILSAYQATRERAHRLMLVLMPREGQRAQQLAAICAQRGLSAVQRSVNSAVPADIDVVIADIPAERGLWYRIAPLCYIGGSFSEEGAQTSPWDAAALGSAILNGPHYGAYHAEFERLREADATLALDDISALPGGVLKLCAPHRAAARAHAAWDVISQGAEASQQIITRAQELCPALRQEAL